MTVKIYLLDKETIDGVEQPRGIEHISNAILDVEGTQFKLTMDTTVEQGKALAALAVSTRQPTPDELQRYQAEDFTPPETDIHQEIDELKARIDALESARV